MEKIDMTFIRNVESKLEDCTSPIQFREVLIKFRPYLYNGQIIKLFQNRLDKISSLRTTNFDSDIFDDLEEELESIITTNCHYSTDASIIKKSSKGRKKDKPLDPESVIQINLTVTSKEGFLMEDVKRELIKISIEKALGKNKEVCRILGITMQELSDIIKEKDIKSHTRKVKHYVKKTILKNKILDN